jgi:hypothetical protein
MAVWGVVELGLIGIQIIMASVDPGGYGVNPAFAPVLQDGYFRLLHNSRI